MESFKHELEILVVPFKLVTYLPEEGRYAPINENDINKIKTFNLFGARLRKRLKACGHIP